MSTPRIFTGRRALVSDRDSIGSAAELLDDLADVMPTFVANRREIAYLMDYYRSDHKPILHRTKKIRNDVNNKVVIDFALAATRDIVGYYLGKPIQYVHMESDDGAMQHITDFNRILQAENKNLANMEIAVDQSIAGVGYLGIFKDRVKKNGTSLKLKRCDPEFHFVVQSSNPEIDELYCCAFYTRGENSMTGTDVSTTYTVWTANHRYEFTAPGGVEMFSPESVDAANIVETEFSYGGYLPIQEYPNNTFRMGDWEAALSLMDAIDFSASDRSNDITQTVQAILVALGIDLTQPGVLEQLESKGLLNIPAVAEGAHDPRIEYIGTPLDPTIGESFSNYLESCLNIVVGIPDRKTRGGVGGDTGAAVELRDGWADIDIVASFKEPFFIKADRESLGAILYLLKTNKDFDGLDVSDIDIKFSRNKTSNIQSKSQAFSAFIGSGLHPQDAVEMCDLTTDVLSVVKRMEQYKDEVQDNALDYAKKQQSELGETPNAAVGSQSSKDNKTEPVKKKPE